MKETILKIRGRRLVAAVALLAVLLTGCWEGVGSEGIDAKIVNRFTGEVCIIQNYGGPKAWLRYCEGDD